MTVLDTRELEHTGIAWIGTVPNSWTVTRMKHLFSERNEKGYPDEPLLAATQTKGVVLKSRYENRTVEATRSLELLKLVEVGDFVVSLRSFQGGIERSYDRGIISPAYTVLHVRDGAEARYMRWLLKSAPFIDHLGEFVTGIRQGQNIDYEKLARTELPVPPLDEQHAIADFLDVMDARISRYIAAKRRLIALLDEQKQAIINQAVTRGLDLDVPLKPSGVDWLGDIPAHWDVQPIKRAMENLNTRRVPLSGDERGQMKDRRFDYYGASGIIDCVEDYLFDEDLLLIAEDGANLVLRNLPLAVVARGKYWVNNHAHILRPRHGLLEYFAHRLETIDYRPWISGAAQPKLTQDRLMSILIAIPALEEQHAIVQAIQKSTYGPERAQEVAKREMNLVSEYRTRLISDVVTGKLDVRGVEPSAVEEYVDAGIDDALDDDTENIEEE